MDKKILVLDIDGTLTNSKKEVTAATKKAIDEMMERGHACMLASGRPTPGMKHVADALDFSDFGGYLLSFNGAKIIKYDTKEVIYQKVLEHHYIDELFQFAKEHDCGILSYSDDIILSGNGIDEYVEIESRINKLEVKELDNFSEYITFDVNKCLMTTAPEKAEKLVKVLAKKYEGQLSIYRSEPFFIEIMPLGIDKAASLDIMLPMIGFSKETCVACGDGFNDLTMIKYAGVGVAMSNAQPEVKEVADYITLSNDEDGLIPVIEKFLL
ncbi:MAG: Cof-type HAD-IIB family hydrolase [Lachnospiraceae bacterium]